VRRAVPYGLVLLVASVGITARATPARPELTLDQALAMARKANRSLLVERTRLAQAQTNLDLAWTVLFPTVTAQGKYTRNDTSFSFQIDPSHSVTVQPKNQLDGAVSFTVPLLVPSAYAAVQAARLSTQAAEENFAAQQTTILFGVAKAFYAAAITEEVLAARQSNIEVARATLQNAQVRYQNGSVTKVDVDRAELAVVQAEQGAREARFAQDQAYRALATLIQAKGDFKVRVGAEAAPDTSTDLASALRLRPEYRALELGARSAAAQARAYGWRWAPSLSGFGSLRTFNYDNFARNQHSWAIGAQLDWALYDGGARDVRRRLAKAQAEEATAQGAVLRDTIGDDLANARGLLETKRHARAAAERSVALAQETLALVRTQYAAGNVAQIDLLQAQNGLVAAEEALAQAHFEVAVADLTLRRAAGTFPGPLP
jgi:outer membrane protein TolC